MVKQQLLAHRAVNFPYDRIRSLFPALSEEPSLIFFDNGAGAQIPQGVFDAINGHFLHRPSACEESEDRESPEEALVFQAAFPSPAMGQTKREALRFQIFPRRLAPSHSIQTV